ncbi:hypothetical protein ABIA45_006566 [Bradyrhizobium sp. USDA 336]
MNPRGAEIDGVGVGDAGRDLPAEHLFGIAFRGADFVGLALQMFGETVLRGFQLLQRHVLLADQIAFAVALARPPSIFGEGKACRSRVQFADQAEHLVVEFGFGKRQRGVCADHRARSSVGRKAVEILIANDRGPLLGDLEQARLDRLELVGADRGLADDAAAEVALADPDRILLDSGQAIRQAGEPRLDRDAQLLGGGGKRGITAEQLVAGVANQLAVVPGKQRQPVGDRAVGLRGRGHRRQCQQRKHRQHDESHSKSPPHGRRHASAWSCAVKWVCGGEQWKVFSPDGAQA